MPYRVTLIFILCLFALTPAYATEQRYRIEYSTFLGGKELDQLREVILYKDGSILVGGQSHSDNYPTTTGVIQPDYAGEPAGSGYPGIFGGDMILSHLSADGRKLLASTYFGGSKQERSVYAMALDKQGNIIFSSVTRSKDLPTTPDACQHSYGGGPLDMMAAKVTADLSRLIWSTYIGGKGKDENRAGFALDPDDNVVLAGLTTSPDFATPGAFEARGNGWDVAIAKLKADGSKLLFASRFGGSENEALLGVAVGADATIHYLGHSWSDDMPVVNALQPESGGSRGSVDSIYGSLSADGTKLLQSSYLGGSRDEYGEHPVLLLTDGSRILTGNTGSSNFPVTANALDTRYNGKTDAYIAKLSADGRSFDFVTFFGGSGDDMLLSPVVDKTGNIYVVGETTSRDMPVTADALQKKLSQGSDGYFGIISPDGSKLLYGTYLGGSGNDIVRSIAISKTGAVYLVGKTSSSDFPVTSQAFQTSIGGNSDGFIVKLTPGQQP